jgi:hypothetical protein
MEARFASFRYLLVRPSAEPTEIDCFAAVDCLLRAFLRLLMAWVMKEEE